MSKWPHLVQLVMGAGPRGWDWLFPNPNRYCGMKAPQGSLRSPKPCVEADSPSHGGLWEGPSWAQQLTCSPQLLLPTWQQRADSYPASFLSIAARQLGAHFVLRRESRMPSNRAFWAGTPKAPCVVIPYLDNKPMVPKALLGAAPKPSSKKETHSVSSAVFWPRVSSSLCFPSRFQRHGAAG